MIQNDERSLQFCESGLQEMWRGEVEAAIALYDRAFEVVESEEVRELITIRKAEALIAAGREGAEVGQLPGIVIRRRTPRLVYMASAVLIRRFTESDDRKRAIFYGEIARTAVAELGEPLAQATVLNYHGITLVADSQFAKSIEAFNEALTSLLLLDENDQRGASLRIAILANLGGAKVLSGEYRDGIRLLEGSLPGLDEDYARSEAYLDLAYAYLELGMYDRSEKCARQGLELAQIPRQVRNGNYLLGETFVRTERHEEADRCFDVVASFYPDFRHVKELLVGVDLCAVINWKS
jgi:tetratricopeptide (TPR) repeat protein